MSLKIIVFIILAILFAYAQILAQESTEKGALLAASKCDVATAKSFFGNDIKNESIDEYKGEMLQVAVEVNCIELFDFLLAFKADINFKSKNRGDTPLMTAALFGRAGLAERLISAGANINHKDDIGWTALKTAVVHKKHEIIKILIDAGADTKVKDEYGNSLLFDALGNIELVKFFIAKGIDIDAKNNQGWTALVYAASSSRPDVLKFLITSGANPNIRDNQLKTPLMLAAVSGSVESVKVLLSIGVDVNAEDADKKSALMYAADAKENRVEIIKLLKDAGAIESRL